jgi:hypothetical protein
MQDIIVGKYTILSYEAARYDYENYLLTFSGLLGWTLSAAEAPNELSLQLTDAEAKELLRTWELAKQSEADMAKHAEEPEYDPEVEDFLLGHP